MGSISTQENVLNLLMVPRKNAVVSSSTQITMFPEFGESVLMKILTLGSQVPAADHTISIVFFPYNKINLKHKQY